MNPKLSQEEKLIRQMTRGLKSGPGVRLGVGDDCAVLGSPRGKLMLLASDMLVSGVHFRPSTPWTKVGWKAMAVNLSDIAAMGGLPRYAVVSMGLPQSTSTQKASQLAAGLRRCAAKFGVAWVGGDTVRSPHLVLDVAILGEAEPQSLVTRHRARAGDWLLVTGHLGGAVRSGRHLSFTPRLYEARALVKRAKPSAMMDLSDGLLVDLGRLCRASGLQAVLQTDQIPRSPRASLQQALTEGEDFELLLAAPKSKAEALLRWARSHLPCRLSVVGRLVRGRPQVLLRDAHGKPLSVRSKGFAHFR